ncbi:MAG: hypothetical protein D6694_00310, partial [Gammaproteobacteria bacterium]
MKGSYISIRTILTRFKKKIALTLLLVLVEIIIQLLFPLFIGVAINDLLVQRYQGVLWLGGMGLLALLIGSGRRFYDTRTYAEIYMITAEEVVAKEKTNGGDISTLAARVSLLREFIEFLENSMPAVLTSLIGVVGTLVIIAAL